MYGQEFSAVLPNQQRNPLDTWMQLRQQQQEQQRYEQHRQDEQAANNEKWLMYAANRMDPSHWDDIVSPYSKVVQTSLDSGIADVTQHLKDNPTDYAGALMKIGKVTGAVNRFYNAGKQVKAQVDAAVKEYGSNPSVDANKLRSLAMTKAFYKYDPNSHAVAVKSPEEISADEDLVTPLLGEVITGTDGLYNSLQKLKPREVGNTEETRSKNGVVKKIKYTGNIMPYQSVGYDDKGNAIPVVKSTKETFSDGSQADALHPDAYNLVFNDPVSQAIVDKAVSQMGVQPKNKQDLDILRRVAGKHLLASYEMGGIKNEDVEKAPLPPRVSVHINNGKTDVPVRDAWMPMVNAYEQQGVKDNEALKLNYLDKATQQSLVDAANKLTGGKFDQMQNKKVPITNADIAIRKDQDGQYYIVPVVNGHWDKGMAPIAPVSEADVNVGIQSTGKQKVKSLSNAQNHTSESTPSWKARAKKL